MPVLLQAGFEVTGMSSALALYRALVSTRFDAVLLDVELPDEDGFEIARHLRTQRDPPKLIMLTGRGSDAARRRADEVGVAAFLVKPVDRATLVDALRAVFTQSAPAGSWSLDPRGWRLYTPTGSVIALSLQEHQVMQLLAATPGVPVKRDALIARLVDDVEGFDPHRLEMLVYRLRRKCTESANVELPIRTVRSVGYVLTW